MAYQTLVDGENMPAGFEIQGAFAAFTLDSGGAEIVNDTAAHTGKFCHVSTSIKLQNGACIAYKI